MPSYPRWVLVDTIQGGPVVVLAGDTPKNRPPLDRFLRGNPEKDAILAVVSATRRDAEAQLVETKGGRTIRANPVVGMNLRVHGVWFQVLQPGQEPSPRPAAWAVSWDLDRRIATRPEVLREPGSVPAFWSLAEALQHIDLRENTVDALAMIVDPARAKNSIHAYATMYAQPARIPRKVRFSAAVCTGDDTAQIRGLTYDVGPESGEENSKARRIADIVATAPSPNVRYRAIVDLPSLKIVFWYGDAPERLAWRLHDRTTGNSYLHPDDVVTAEAIAEQLRTGGPGTVVDTEHLRFEQVDGRYATFRITATTIQLNPHVSAAFVTMYLSALRSL